MSSSDGNVTRSTQRDCAVRRPSRGGVVECGDSLALLSTLGDGCCDLIYVDPPFTSSGTHRQRVEPASDLQDVRAGGLPQYLAFLRPRLVEMQRVLSSRGSLCVHLDWRTVHHVKVLLDELFGPHNFLNEIVWSYRTGGRPGKWFSRKHDTLLLYAKSIGRHTFNRLHDGQYRTQDLLFTEDGRPYKSTRNGPVYFHPQGPALPDVWEIPFLSTVSKERTGYPYQKPEALLERIVLASSNEGDLVADFFCGSGTTLAVAKRLGRRWLGCDINTDAVAITRQRLERIKKDAPARC